MVHPRAGAMGQHIAGAGFRGRLQQGGNAGRSADLDHNRRRFRVCHLCPDLPLSNPRPYLSGSRKRGKEVIAMCRNIRTLFNFEPPATDAEIRASALQFVRKLSGFTAPSKANTQAFERAVEEVTEAAQRLIASLETQAPPRDRDVEAAKAKARARERYGAA